DYGLGPDRTERLATIHIFQQGRSKESKLERCAGLAEAHSKEFGLAGDNVVVSVIPNDKGDWSFGLGQAQNLIGDQ
ncbi:4-oxalocrotonate tautomerase, partial [Fusarium oxysporum]